MRFSGNAESAARAFVFALAPVLAQAAPAPAPPPAASAPAPAPALALTPPRLLSDGDVPYPAGATGDAAVLLTITVSADGTVRAAVPAEPNEPFSTSAVQAALAWRYDPATRDGKPVAARIRVEIRFHAPESAPESAPAPALESAPAPAPPSPDEPLEIENRGAVEEPARTASLSRAEVRQIPGVFGDPFRAVEIMPGVTPIISGLPFFYIRGAPPGDVGYYLDGVRVPYLFHVGAGPSVVHPAVIDRVDLFPGGYPARFGRFAGGIVDGETTGPADHLHGEFALKLGEVSALAETPFAGGKGDISLSGRYSFAGLALSILSPSTVLSYWDYQGRASYDLTPRDRLGVFAFGADDFLGQKANGTTLTIFGTQFHRVDVRYDHHFDGEGTMRTAFTLGEDLTDVGDGNSVRDRILGVRNELHARLSRGVVLRTGVDAETDTYDVLTGVGALGPAETSLATGFFPSRTDLSAGVRADLVIDVTRGFEVTPGARLDFFASQGSTAIAVDPRLQGRIRVRDPLHLLWAMGVAHQPPSFTIPIPGIQPAALTGGLQTAVQESAGLEWNLGFGTTATATFFHNDFINMSDSLGVSQPTPNGCVPGSFPVDTLAGDTGAPPDSHTCAPRFPKGTLGSDETGGGGQGAEGMGTQQTIQSLETRTNGTAYGFELFVKRTLTDHLSGFLSYTLSRSTRTYLNQTFLSAFDRTHVLDAAVSYDLGRKWRAGGRVLFYTGVPKAPDPSNSSTRLAPFVRLDVRLEKRWDISRRLWISFVAEWLNVTFTKEQVATTCTLQGCKAVSVGPITVPNIGVEGGF